MNTGPAPMSVEEIKIAVAKAGTEIANCPLCADVTLVRLLMNIGPSIDHILHPQPGWLAADTDRASSEGWGLFDSDGILTINKCDDSDTFEFDSHAVGHVRERATAGCQTAQKALALVGRRTSEVDF